MSYILVTRVPTGELVVVEKEPGSGIAAEFDREDLARMAASNTLVCLAHGYDIIEIEV